MANPTVLDIVDSAIKIGLGALIGIVGSMILSSKSHSQELKKEFLRRKRDRLEKIAEDISEAHQFFIEVAMLQIFLKKAPHGWVRAQSQKRFDILIERTHTELLRVGAAKNRLFLIDMVNGAEGVRAHIEAIREVIKRLSDSDGAFDEEKLRAASDDMNKSYAKVMGEFSKDYGSS